MRVSRSSSKGITPSFLTSTAGSLFVLLAALTFELQIRSGRHVRRKSAREVRLLPLVAHRRETCSSSQCGQERVSWPQGVHLSKLVKQKARTAKRCDEVSPSPYA